MQNNSHPSIGSSIQKMRKAHKLTLSVLSQKSGVSAATLSQIEADKVNPTIATLWKIAEGLEIEIQSLLSGLEKQRPMFDVSRKDEITRFDTEEEGVRIRVFSPLSMAEDLEVYTLTFKPGRKLMSQAHPAKTEEFLTVVQGSIRVQAGENEARLEPDDFIRYHADVEHLIENIGEEIALINMVVRFKRGGE
ncbi:MAG TPA: XRE family transcriptional regulator [Clostridia bacterium]|nr:XRE family transcriptional regulator [Clostridia bacterium]